MSALTHRGQRAQTQITTGDENAVADAVFQRAADEIEELYARQREMEKKYPGLIDVQYAKSVPEAALPMYLSLIKRQEVLRKDIHLYSKEKQVTLLRQQEARQKSGELVPAWSVAEFLVRMSKITQKYARPEMMAALRQELKGVQDEFMQQNPAAVLERGAQINEQR
jgi:hypothetical protein